MSVLRPGLLAGRTVVVANGRSAFGERAAASCGELGAAVEVLDVDPLGDEGVYSGGPVDLLVWDGAAAFGDGGIDGVRAALDGAWLAIRPVARAAMIPGDAGGKMVVLAPAPGDAHAEAARAALENLARTLSIEWARFGIRPTAILPGAATAPDEVADLVAFLASPAGDYYAGCAFTLGEAVPR